MGETAKDNTIYNKEGVQAKPGVPTTVGVKTLPTSDDVIEANGKSVSANRAAKEAGNETGVSTYEDIFRRINKEESGELTDAEKRQRQRETLMASIGDGLTAMSAAFFRGGGVKFDPTSGMSERTRARWDRIVKEKEGKAKAYADGLMRAKQLDKADADTERKWKRQLDLDEQKREREEAKLELENHKLEAKTKLDQAKFEYQMAKDANNHELAVRKQEEMERYHRELIAVSRTRIVNSGGRTKYIYNGQEYFSQPEWEAAVIADSNELGVSLWETKTNTKTTDGLAGPKTTTTTTERKKSTGQLAAENKAERERRAKAGGQGNKQGKGAYERGKANTSKTEKAPLN